MTLRRAKNVILLSGAIAIYGAASGVYLQEKGIHLSQYINIPALDIIHSASADTIGDNGDAGLGDFKSLSMPEYTSEANNSAWPELPDLEEIQTYFSFEWPDLPEIKLPEVNLELPEIKLPEIELPNFEWVANITLPEITLPQIEWPDLSFQTFMNGSETVERRGQALSMPTIPSMPSLPAWPDISLPDFEMPTIQMPEFIKNIPVMLKDFASTLKNNMMQFAQAESAPQITEATIQDLADIIPAAGDDQSFDQAGLNDDNALFRHGVKKAETAQNNNDENISTYRYEIEDNTLDVEGVLVPQKATVISSSKDGKIAAIHFDNGEMFRKDDILVEYECKDLKAELEIAEAEKDFTQKRTMRHQKLLNLDIISDIDHLGIKTEDIKAAGQAKIIESRMEQCYIRAAYDGRVTNRLANPHEYTRSDRVLMEVASLDDLEIEFLLPSRWLRWVNVGAPLTLNIEETGETYSAVIERIHGEVDPVSQSIQISAKLDTYESPLLPGMSGNVHLDITAIRDAGIKGFLEEPRYSSADTPPAKP